MPRNLRYRKIWYFTLSLLVVIVLGFTSCSSSTTKTFPSPTTQASNPPATTSQVTPTASQTNTSPTTAQGAVFTVSNLVITPTQVNSRDNVEISVTVTNSGDTAGSYTVTLKINNENMASKSITLNPGASGTVGFTQSRDLPGTYQVDVNGLTGSFTVLQQGQNPTTSTSPTTTTAWTIPTGGGTYMRAVHMGGNWGTNRDNVANPPEEYFEYLRDLNVNWVGISVALHVDGSMDSTVELDSSESLGIPTFTDETLRALIQKFRSHGFNIYIHIAFENTDKGDHPFSRWQLGDPQMHLEDANISAEYWPWRTDHPQYQAFITEFWQTYTDCLVHIGQIAEEEGVGMLTLGTETDRLFRSRSSTDGRWPNNFLTQMQNMVSSVRVVYSGLLSYEMHHSAVTDSFYDAGSDYLFKDLGLDFIAVSAYFPLWPNTPTTVPSVTDLEASWTAVFNEQLKPLQQRNNNLDIIFTEFGYVDSLAALNNASVDEFTNKVFQDNDGNGKDDGEEAQANAYQALFNLMDSNPGMVKGAFLWDVMMSTEQEYLNSFYQMRTFNIRLKLAEAIAQAVYGGWI